MATKSEVITEIAQALGNRSDLNTRIVTRMDQLIRRDLERAPTLPWFLLSENSYTDTTYGEERLPLPADFLREFEDGALWFKPSGATTNTYEPLHKQSHADIRDALGESNQLAATGRPTHYDLVGAYFYLGPIPDDAYRLYLKYYQKDVLPSTLTASETNLWLTYAPDLVIAKVAHRLARELQYRADLIAGFQNDKAEALLRLNIDERARIETNRPREMGEP